MENFYRPNESDLQVLRQSEREISILVKLYDREFTLIDTLEGYLISDNLSVDGDSVVRRTYNAVLQVDGDQLSVDRYNKIWYDRIVKMYYGIKNSLSGSVQWYLMGTFCLIDTNYSYNLAAKTLSINCSDLMTMYDGTKNGGISLWSREYGTTVASYTVEAGCSIDSAVNAVCDEAGIVPSRRDISAVNKLVPYDIVFETGSNWNDIWSSLKALYPNWEYFFDVNGTFIWREIPSALSDEPILTNTTLSTLVIEESLSDSSSGVYNATEVYGQEISLENDDMYFIDYAFADNTASVSNEDILISDWSDMDNFTSLGLRIISDNELIKYIKINDSTPAIIVSDTGSPLEKTYEIGQTYIFRFRRTLTIGNTTTETPNFILLGQFQCYGYYEENSLTCPYSIPNIGYKRLKTVSIDTLYSDELCFNQAEYATYLSTIRQDTLTLKCMIIPFLEPYQKIEYTSKMTGENDTYLIKKFSWSTKDGTMSLELFKFNEDFQYVWEQKYT